MKRLAQTIAVLTAVATLSTAFAQAPMPQPKTDGGITYLNGGAGSEEVDYIKSSMKDYSLALMFSRTGGEYVASVSITIKDSKGATVFDEPSVGPYLLVKLPPGKYSVVATYEGDAKTRPVTIDRVAKTPISFAWK
jgi:hypothetical protein